MQKEIEIIEHESIVPNTVIPISKDQIATRDEIRAHNKTGITQRGKETVRILFENIEVRPGHNGRTETNPGFSDESITELARSIVAEGLHEPLQGDFLKDGSFILTAGERRFRAIGLVRRWIKDGNIKELVTSQKELPSFDYVECFQNPKEFSELDRTKAMLIENTGIPLTPMEHAESIARLKRDGMTAAQIAKSIPGLNTMQVSLRLTLAGLDPAVKDLINEGKISPTAAVKLSKELPSIADQISAINEAADGEDGKLKIKNLPGDESENNLRDKNLNGNDDQDEESPLGNSDRYDEIRSGAADDKSMQGNSGKASTPSGDPAKKAKDDIDTDDKRLTSGRATGFDLTLKAIEKAKAIDKELGIERSPKVDTLLYELDKLLYDLKVILKK